MTRGILLIAFGRHGYGYAAWNLAFSLRKFSPDIEITLLCQPETISHLSPEKQQVFDDIKYIPNELLSPFDPARIKVSIYEYLPYDITLYLDVDSLALQDVTPAFKEFEESELYYSTHIYKSQNYKQGRDFPELWWAYLDDLWKHYNLPEDAQLPATNSSWQFIRKGAEAEKFFSKLVENYENPLPPSMLKNKWGGTQPDELYLDVTMAQMGYGHSNPIMFFGSLMDSRTQEQLKQDYYLLSIFGARNTTKKIYRDWYENLMFAYCKGQGIAHIFKVAAIDRDKHLNNPLKLPAVKSVSAIKSFQPFHLSQAERKNIGLFPSVLTESDGIKIDSSQLIQSYIGPRMERVHVSNWLNCSALEYKGKNYFAYRMESRPFCTRMKIGLCLLDSDLKPIAETNKVLDLRTALKGYTPGYHAEDPRLFTFNDELYLSYTDGYQMGQAKINPELVAEESYYIDKPDKLKTEKNWTFFESEGKLFSVYNIAPHIIFEMNKSKFRESVRQPFIHNWKWGMLSGGTSPQRHGDYFLSFFHSAQYTKYNGDISRQYFIGAYLFESKFPFTPVAISKEPLLAGEPINPMIPRLSNKIYVVFPSGMIRKENSWMVSYGSNDYECKFIEITDKLLEENLVYQLQHA